MNFMQKCKRNGGFTLVELIVVIAILAILAGVAVPAYTGYIKKAEEAADQQLLGAVNTAFAAACLEEGEDAKDVKVNPVVLDKNADGAYSLPATFLANTKYQAAFARYFAGNTGSEFKTIGALGFSEGVFTAVEVSEALRSAYANITNGSYSTQIGLVQGSAYANIGADALLNQVNGVAGIASGLIAGESDLFGVVMNDDYLTTLAGTMDMSLTDLKAQLEDMAVNNPDGMFNLLANSTVLNVSATMQDPTKYNETETLTMLQNANFGGLGTTLNTDPEKGLAQAALLYGMYTAYDPQAAQNITSEADLMGLMNNTEFKAYLADVNTEGTQAYKDYQGYKSALDIVNGAVKDSPDVADQILNGKYNDPQLITLVGSIIG